MLLGGAVALMPVYAKDILEVGPSGLGLMRAAPGVGAMLSLMLAARLPPWERPGGCSDRRGPGFGLATIGFGLSRNLSLSLLCLFLIGATDSISMVIRQTLMQALTPDQLRGRVASVNFLFVGFSNELGAFESGGAAALFGPIFSVVSGGVGTLLVVALVCAEVAGPAAGAAAPHHPSRRSSRPGRCVSRPGSRPASRPAPGGPNSMGVPTTPA